MTLAVGMAKVFASVPGMKSLMAYWYHFVIMFEALFILTLLETGTRVARFVFQEAFTSLGSIEEPARSPGDRVCGWCRRLMRISGGLAHRPHWGLNIIMTLIVCSGWGYLLYMGTLDILWRMLGIANQLLASIALAVGTTYLLLACPETPLRAVHRDSVCIHTCHGGDGQRDEHPRLVGSRYSARQRRTRSFS